MRVEFINKMGGKMTVDESKVDKYIAAGYVPVAKPIEKKEEPIETPKKRRTKKEV